MSSEHVYDHEAFVDHVVAPENWVTTWDRQGRVKTTSFTITFGGQAVNQREAELQNQVQKLTEILQAIKDNPSLFATVLDVGSRYVTISAKGSRVRVKKPADAAMAKRLRRGMPVLCAADTMQIVEIADDDVPTGELVPIKTVVSDRTIEIERGGTDRVIALPEGAKPSVGDRVIVDDTGTIALACLGPAPNQVAFSEKTGVTWEDIGGLTDAKRTLRDAVEGPVKNAAQYARYKRRATNGILLWGPPGCGKTMLGKAAATALSDLHGKRAQGGFFYIKGPELLNMYVGQTESNIRKIFDDARRHHAKAGFPAVIFIDEADAILGKRGDGLVSASSGVLSSTIVPQFLSEMDGLEASHALILLATNRPDTLDPAVVRDGRIDRRIHVSRPDRAGVKDIATRLLDGKPLHKHTATELADTLTEQLWAEDLIVSQRRHQTLRLSHTVNGAMVAGIVERATAHAMFSDAPGITESHITRAVRDSHLESRAVNHDDDFAELTQMALDGANA